MNIKKLHEDGGRFWHIPGAPVTTYETLCGFCDTYSVFEEKEGVPDCPSCLAVLKYCKSLRMPRNPRQGPQGRNPGASGT